jgi:hypothetical protein
VWLVSKGKTLGSNPSTTKGQGGASCRKEPLLLKLSVILLFTNTYMCDSNIKSYLGITIKFGEMNPSRKGRKEEQGGVLRCIVFISYTDGIRMFILRPIFLDSQNIF